jgi:TonB family protein
MSRDARFWRNVALITIAHLAVLLALARGSRNAAATNVQPIMWMNSEAMAAEPKSPAGPTPVATPPEIEKQEEPAAPTLARSEIQLPSPTPTPTPTPKPTPKPSVTPTPVRKSSPTPTPRPSPKASPRKTVETKPTPKPSPKKEKADDEKKAAPKESTPGSNQGTDKSSSPGRGNGATQASEFAWYGTMLHDRFHKAWEQPKSIVATGAKMSTLVKIRIEKDGRVSRFTIVKPSGNVVVDESVAAIAQRVTQVDPLPAGLSSGAYYEVKIDFELNAEK